MTSFPIDESCCKRVACVGDYRRYVITTTTSHQTCSSLISQMLALIFVLVAFAAITADAFTATSFSSVARFTRCQSLKMAYLPEGFTQKQWDMLKKKEEDDKKKKQGALGTTKFRSRSFEAWQKSGGKHLFPVDPLTTPYEERPYMQRKDGDWEGNDLKKMGLKGLGQGVAEKKLKLDEIYEDAKAAGKLNSASIFGGINLPWTNKAAEDMNKQLGKDMKGKGGVAGKKLTPQEMALLRKNLVKPIVTPKKGSLEVVDAPPKKKLFGLW